MKFTGLEVLDSTIHRTSAWLKDLMQELNWSDRRKTYLTLRCVLHAFRDHISVEDAVILGNELPMLIRGMYFEDWKPSTTLPQIRSREEFYAFVTKSLVQTGETDFAAETVTQAVLRLLERKSTEGEIKSVQQVLPDVLQDLWPGGLQAA